MSFMVQDMMQALLAVCLFPLFLLFPGYLAASKLGVCAFRRRSLGTRLALGVVMSVMLTPGLTYLLSRVWSLELVCALVVMGFLLFVFMRASRAGWRELKADLRSDPVIRPVLVTAVLWMSAAIFLMGDFQIADLLYPAAIAHDYAWRIAVTGAISRTDVPPINPAFYPGAQMPLYYYYFWFMTCSLVDLLGGSWVGPRAALVAGSAWLGLALMAIVALYTRVFREEDRRTARRSVLTALALLLISGLDIVPVTLNHLYQWSTVGMVLLPSVEWWNETNAAWPHSALWVPHHLAGLVATLTLLLLLTELSSTHDTRRRRLVVLTGSLGFLSALGLSIWVTLTFAVFWCAWLLLAFAKRWSAEARAGVSMALGGATLSLPFLSDLYTANLTHVSPIAVSVRMFGPLHAWLHNRQAGWWTLFWADFVSLPVNYALEFGFFGLAAMLYWRHRWANPAPLARHELLLATLAASALFIGTFLRSNIVNNDLGYRSLLFVQFVLLLWSLDVVHAVRHRRKALHSPLPIRRRMAAVLLTTAILGTLPLVYDTAVMKLYAMAGDLQLPARRIFGFLHEENLGRRYYAFREAYQWVNQHVPEVAIVQHNPEIFMDVPSGLYGNRQVVAADRYYGPQFGIGYERYQPIAAAVSPIFVETSTTPVEIGALCQRFGITALVVKDTDPVWNDPQSWVFRERPAFANSSARVFTCATFVAGQTAVRPSSPVP